MVNELKNETQTEPLIRFFISVIGIVFLAVILMELKSILIPFILAFFLLFLLEPLHRKLKNIHLVFLVSIDLLLISALFWGIYQILVKSYNEFYAAFPVYKEKIIHLSSEIQNYLNTDNSFLNLESISKKIDFSFLAQKIFLSTFDIFTTTFMILLFYVFIVFGQQSLQQAIKKRVKVHNQISESRIVWETIISAISNQVVDYFITKFLLSVLMALLAGFVLWIFNVDFVVIWILLTFLLNFIPTIGAFISIVFPFIFTSIQFESIGYGFLILILLLAIHSIIGNLIEPKLLGEKLDINPLVILLSLFIWGYIWGIIGMLIAVPLISIIKIIFSQYNSPNAVFFNELISLHKSE